MSLHRVCCCGGGNCCKCHPVYGGATSWTVTWSGNVTISPPNCACLVSVFGAPYANADAVVGTYTITTHSYVFDWTNPFDPLTCTVKAVTGSSNFVQTSVVDYELYDISRGGACTYDSGPYSTGARQRVTVSVHPPDCAVPRTNWEVVVLVSGVVSWTFTGSTSCTTPGPFTLTSTTTVVANGACAPWSGGPPAVHNYSSGTVTIT